MSSSSAQCGLNEPNQYGAKLHWTELNLPYLGFSMQITIMIIMWAWAWVFSSSFWMQMKMINGLVLPVRYLSVSQIESIACDIDVTLRDRGYMATDCLLDAPSVCLGECNPKVEPYSVGYL